MADVLGELEESAQVLLAPPTLVTSAQRHAAEAFFLNFRRTKSPFMLCRHILENCKVEYVLYQAAALLKEALIREWSLLPKSDIESLRTYLLQYVIEKQSLPPYVREQILQVIAIMVKRSSVDGVSGDKELILSEVSRLINSGSPIMQTIGCSILSALLNEYASTVKSSDVGLTWEVHFQAKKQFESTDLKRIFEFCLQVLYELEQCNETRSEDFLALLNRFLTIAEQVLSWNFIYSNLPKKLIGVFEADQSPSLRPGAAWREVLMEQSVVDLFFKLHWKIRSNYDISHHSINCLIQLASLHGTIFADRESRPQYLSYFLQGLVKLMTSCTSAKEALGLANIISKMVLFFPPPVLILVPKDILEAFLNELAQMTCRFAELSAHEDSMAVDQLYTEAFNRLLEAWVTLFHDIQVFPSVYCNQAAIQILETVLRCHLAPPDGIRKEISSSDHEEIDETEDDDRVRFKDQLSTIGMFGRHSLAHIVPLLIKLLETRVGHLQTHLQRIHQQVITPNDTTALTTVYEDLHWLILITGHILAMDNEGETCLIPSEVMQYSCSQSSTANLEVTIKILTSPGHLASEFPGVDQSCDHTIRLITTMFRLAEVERRALEANLVHLLSPELSSTLMWFFRRWSLFYLLPNETYYSEISPSLNAAFGRDTETGRWCLSFLLSKVDSNLSVWTSEPKVVNDTVQLLVALVDNKDRGSRMAKCESLWHLVRKHANNDLGILPPTACRGLLRALVLAGLVAPDQTTREQYWLQVLKPLQDKFKDLICQDNFARSFHEERVKQEVIHLLDSFIGVVQGSDIQNIHYIFSFLHPILSEFVTLIGLYHNYQDVVEQILEFFCECAKRMLCYLDQTDTGRLYECCLSMIRTFAKYNTGKKSYDSSSEEDQYQDILLLMELLTNLLSKDFIDFSPVSSGEGNSSVSAADITLFGLHIIMPMMNEELLKFPRLCLQYFKMITFVCEIYPEKICQLPDDLLKNLMASVQLGLAIYGSDITTLCLDFLTVLGTHVFKVRLRNTFVYDSLKPFLKIVLDMLLLQNFDSDLLQTASCTLFALICCYQDHYQELVNNLLQSQNDPVYYQRLVTAFNGLMLGIQLTEERPNRIKFRDNFEKFIAEVRGFLCVK